MERISLYEVFLKQQPCSCSKGMGNFLEWCLMCPKIFVMLFLVPGKFSTFYSSEMEWKLVNFEYLMSQMRIIVRVSVFITYNLVLYNAH